MKFDHVVNHDGVYYPAGTDVPVEENVNKEVPEEKPKAGRPKKQ